MTDRPQSADHFEKIGSGPPRPVGMAIISTDGAIATCSCRWVSKPAKRVKVREDRIDAHLRKKHSGRGIRV